VSSTIWSSVPGSTTTADIRSGADRTMVECTTGTPKSDAIWSTDADLTTSDLVNSASKIVVIDDTAEILDLIDVVLTDEGYEVVACQDAAEAIDTVALERPALVIADLRMAGVHRWELVDALIADPRTGRMPIIVCSGAAAELRAAEERLRERGGDVLVKPFDIEVLVRKVREMLGTA
jgi:CheY-like chemotaxis protein